MAYLRMTAGAGEFPPCDVYVYDDVTLGLVCSNCWLAYLAGEGPHFIAASTRDMVDHLNHHRAAGHAVPWFEETVAELWEDDPENFPAS